ncbi:MAG: adenylosuccinate lyase [Sphaerochaetaceae bacterium]|nr:adenylosuccinate lyase [Sphaerochaetaceae bacterium]
MDWDDYLSPFTWRYGSEEMRSIWSETSKRRLLRRFWVALAKAQCKAALVSQAQVDDLVAHKDDIDIPKALEIEADIKHDLMAEIKTYESQCPVGGSIIHLGATSMDALDNADAIRLKDSADLIIRRLKDLLGALKARIDQTADYPCMAFTHLQSAEPTTIGYRLSQYAQDLLEDLEGLKALRIKAKGLKGAVGTCASYVQLLRSKDMSASELEDLVMKDLGLEAFDAATQVYPRKQDLRIMQALSALACSTARLAMDFRMLQSSAIGEWSESFSAHQVGSSAMPFKRNPINCEKVSSLSRYVNSLLSNAWDNASLSILERTLDDSANRRIFLSEAFLCCDEILITMAKVIGNMDIHSLNIQQNFSKYGVFASTEILLMEAVKKGANRQSMHEVIRQKSLKAWSDVQSGLPNHLREELASDPEVNKFIDASEAYALLDAEAYTGLAGSKAKAMSRRIAEAL